MAEAPYVSLAWPLPGVALATLERGDAFNTLTHEMIAGIDAAVSGAAAGAARVLILTGSGRAFCGGAHVKYFSDPASPLAGNPDAIRETYVRPIIAVFDRLQTMPFVTIAAINGVALGGGCELALACDFRLVARSAKLGLPEVRLGAVAAAGGMQQLPKIVGRARALEIALLGDHLSPDEALAAGLVTAVHDDSGLMQAALDMAGRLTRLSPVSIAQTKRAIYRCQTESRGSSNEIALDALTIATAGPDWTEGMTAFVEKRPPGFAL